MKSNKYNKQSRIMLSAMVTLLLVALSYGYVRFNPSNENKQNVTMETGSLKLVYNDCATDKQEDCANITSSMVPVETITKTFSVQNVSTTDDANFYIYFKELQNTFKNDELVYTLVNTSSNQIITSDTPVPYSTATATNKYLSSKLTINKNTIQNYKLTITFLNKDYDQVDNESTEFRIKLGLTDKHD